MRNSQTFKEVVEHVNEIYSRKIKGESIKYKLYQTFQLSTSSMSSIKREENIEKLKSEDKNLCIKILLTLK